MPSPDRSHALDHVVVVLFENRSLDNVLGHLYSPADGKIFDGVIGKNLSNPIPAWAEHGVVMAAGSRPSSTSRTAISNSTCNYCDS
jgi:hypothetical protein